MDELMELPGVGHYTAGAIRNFAFGIPTPCMDVNIRRIVHRFFVGPENPDGTWKVQDADLLPLTQKIMVEAISMGRGWAPNFFAALMDFGSAVCTKKNPKWELMTKKMQSVCMSYGKKIETVKSVTKKEPGRMMAGKFIPNRIFRGRIIEVLRDAKTGLTRERIGEQAIADWTMGDHAEWLQGLLEKLQEDGLLETSGKKYRLKA
jgi:A/G-specific adenine glycosylase